MTTKKVGIWLPDSIDILGIEYSVEYMDKPSDVDIYKRESLWGQVDYWTRSIRVYVGEGRPLVDTWQTLVHEVVHAICSQLNIEALQGEDHNDDVDLLALGLVNVLFANDWLTSRITIDCGGT